MFFVFKQKTAYEVRISDWSSDVCSSDLLLPRGARGGLEMRRGQGPSPHAKHEAIDGRIVRTTRPRGNLRRHILADRSLACAPQSRCPDRSEERRVGQECVST